MRGRTVTVKLRTPDFKTATRRVTPDEPPASADELVTIAVSLIERFDFPPDSRFRLAGVGVSNFVGDDEDEEQPVLFA